MNPLLVRRSGAEKAARLAIGIATTAGIVLLVGCHGKSDVPAKTVSPVGAQSSAIQVNVAPARLETISNTIQVTGSLNALHDVTVSVKAPGKIVAVYAREGDIVRAGQVVAQQDTVDLQSQLDQSRANLLSAQTKLAQAQFAFTDTQTNLKLTDEQTRSAVQLAQAGLQSAREQLSIVKQGARTQERAQAQQTVEAAAADVTSAQADIDNAKVDQAQARKDLKRYQSLARQDAISQQQLDQAQTTADSADSRYNVTVARKNSLDAKLNSAKQNLSLVQEGARQEDIRRAQAGVEQARQQVIAAVSNRGQVVLRRADVETARSGIAAAQAGIGQVQAAVRISEQALRDSSVRSPIPGVVAERKVEPGMQIAVVKPDVMRIVALDSIYFDAQLPETQYAAVHYGQPVMVNVDALPGKTFRGSVSKIFPVASSPGRSFTARIDISNNANVLRPQMFARGIITLTTHAQALVVAREALLDYDYNRKVGRLFVASHNIAQERKVKTGIATPTVVEITSGLVPGESVIVNGQSQIQNKDKIQVLSSKGASQSE